MLSPRIHPVSGKSPEATAVPPTAERTSHGVHMIGIGGIGVSALARFYRSRGVRVSGSDIARSEITDALVREGIRVTIGPHRKANLPHGTTRVIYTAAVRPDNPELREARRRGIPVKTYAAALGEVSANYRAIAVAGSHGKSTTTALTGLILAKAGLDPTVIVGTKLREFTPPAGGSNFRSGRSPWLVLEADEYRRSFLHYAPAIAVVTNIDREHLDYYRTITNIETAFLKFLRRIRPDGMAVLNRDDARLRRIGRGLRRLRPDVKIAWHSLRDPLARRIGTALRIPGRHNVANALAALTVGRQLRIPSSKIFSALHSYRGAWRRFDYQGVFAGAKVFADYAHHPTEIKATLQAARERFPNKRVWCVFQPHHYERLKTLFPEFGRAFSDCDALVFLDVYEVAGRERMGKSGRLNSERLAGAVARHGTPALHLPDSRRLRRLLKRWLAPGDVLLMMGAGDVWEMTKRLMRGKGGTKVTKGTKV